MGNDSSFLSKTDVIKELECPSTSLPLALLCTGVFIYYDVFSTDECLIGFMGRGRRLRNTVQHSKERILLCFPESQHPSIHLLCVAEHEVNPPPRPSS